MDSEKLINELIDITKANKEATELFLKQPIDTLNFKKSTDSWSILECIEHLNRYGNFYIPEIKKQIAKSTHSKSNTFNSGILGNYFAKSMFPKEKLNKMKTFQSMNPNNSSLDTNVLNVFLDQQDQLIELLSLAKLKDLKKIKTSISISKWIRLRLGDTFRVVIYHNLRHVEQANNLLD